MRSEDRIKFIVHWIQDYCKSLKKQPVTLIIGVSGGVDSAVTSTICEKTDWFRTTWGHSLYL